MSWLNPTLHAQSASHSSSPMLGAFPGAMPVLDAGSGFAFDGMPLPPMDVAARNPTRCALHGSFLGCLRAPWCSCPGLGAAPFYGPTCPSFVPTQTPALPAPGAQITPAFAVFPNPQLAQSVRSESHLIPGSVPLGNALGGVHLYLRLRPSLAAPSLDTSPLSNVLRSAVALLSPFSHVAGPPPVSGIHAVDILLHLSVSVSSSVPGWGVEMDGHNVPRAPVVVRPYSDPE